MMWGMVTEEAGEDGRFISDALLDLEDLKTLQDRFCEVTDLFVFCVGTSGNPITEISGNKQEADRVAASVTRSELEDVLHRMTQPDSIEDQIVEQTRYANVRLAAVANRIEGRLVCSWMAYAVLAEPDGEGPLLEGVTTVTTQKRLYQALNLMRDTCQKIMECKYRNVEASAQMRRNRSSEQQMSESLRRLETYTEIVQFLESEEAIDQVMQGILERAGSYLELSSCQVFRRQKAGDCLDLLTEWLAPGITSIFEKTMNIPRPEILYADKPLILSSGMSLPAAETDYLQKMHLKAVVMLPLQIGGKTGMYVSFCECRKERQFQQDELKFLGDTGKIMQSILTRRLQKNSLASSYEALEHVLDNVGSAIYVRDEESGELLFGNSILRRDFARELKEGTLDQIIRGSVQQGQTTGNYEIRHEGRRRWYDIYVTTIRWVDDRNVLLYALHDITDKKIYQNRIEQQAYTDFLTGLYNRLCCERDLAWHIDQAKKDGTVGALLYLDLDDFKHINDGLGHRYGDTLLKAISRSLQRVEGINNTCYRVGGDEFVIIVPPECYERFEKIIRDIREIFSKPWSLKDADYYCTMSMGIVNFPTEGENVQELIKKADIAMYEAKKGGKNRVSQYQARSAADSNKRLDLEKNMRDATVDGYKEFEVYFQPIVDNRRTGCPCIGAEALIRWHSEELGAISPAEFIPLAEYLGLINPIGNYVLEQACIACRHWNEAGHPEYKVNVNLSVVQLLQTDIVEVIARTIRKTGVNPANLTLEVTESLAINDMERMKRILGSIKKLGARIALDDFGTGYSSLNHIREMPLDVIKVDQNFVRELATDSYSQSFIKMVTELADAIDVNVCVEGIETEEQYRVLSGMKVSMIQGFYFGRPMPRSDFEVRYL